MAGSSDGRPIPTRPTSCTKSSGWRTRAAASATSSAASSCAWARAVAASSSSTVAAVAHASAAGPCRASTPSSVSSVSPVIVQVPTAAATAVVAREKSQAASGPRTAGGTTQSPTVAASAWYAVRASARCVERRPVRRRAVFQEQVGRQVRLRAGRLQGKLVHGVQPVLPGGDGAGAPGRGIGGVRVVTPQQRRQGHRHAVRARGAGHTRDHVTGGVVLGLDRPALGIGGTRREVLPGGEADAGGAASRARAGGLVGAHRPAGPFGVAFAQPRVGERGPVEPDVRQLVLHERGPPVVLVHGDGAGVLVVEPGVLAAGAGLLDDEGRRARRRPSDELRQRREAGGQPRAHARCPLRVLRPGLQGHLAAAGRGQAGGAVAGLVRAVEADPEVGGVRDRTAAVDPLRVLAGALELHGHLGARGRQREAGGRADAHRGRVSSVRDGAEARVRPHHPHRGRRARRPTPDQVRDLDRARLAVEQVGEADRHRTVGVAPGPGLDLECRAVGRGLDGRGAVLHPDPRRAVEVPDRPVTGGCRLVPAQPPVEGVHGAGIRLLPIGGPVRELDHHRDADQPLGRIQAIRRGGGLGVAVGSRDRRWMHAEHADRRDGGDRERCGGPAHVVKAPPARGTPTWSRRCRWPVLAIVGPGGRNWNARLQRSPGPRASQGLSDRIPGAMMHA